MHLIVRIINYVLSAKSFLSQLHIRKKLCIIRKKLCIIILNSYIDITIVVVITTTNLFINTQPCFFIRPYLVFNSMETASHARNYPINLVNRQ